VPIPIPYPRRQAASNDVLYPELVDPRVADVEALARWLDYAFVLPGGFRYGLAGFIDLIPGIGDVIDAVLSLYIVSRAVQLGVPRVTLTRMVVNVGIEGLAGTVPFMGAVFDTVFKANRRNYQLLRDHISTPKRTTKKDWGFLIVAGVVAVLSSLLPIVVLFELIKHL
jgi:Domain of unknown function (DUF4112)